jgi:GH15 family glucan-1,4-alpha-glucosidase
VIAEFIEQRCFSPTCGSYARCAGSTELDASVLLGLLAGYGDRDGPRWRHTVDAIIRELGHGPFLYRYTGQDGLAGSEGAFLPCSFWLAEALALTGRIGQAGALLDELVGLANDVGLYSEEVDPPTGEFLGNVPQALSHLALISAATTIAGQATSTARPPAGEAPLPGAER